MQGRVLPVLHARRQVLHWLEKYPFAMSSGGPGIVQWPDCRLPRLDDKRALACEEVRSAGIGFPAVACGKDEVWMVVIAL